MKRKFTLDEQITITNQQSMIVFHEKTFSLIN